jgi:hypothetical protein
MTQTFTHDDVIRYVYAETSHEENTLIEEAMIEDADLLMFYLDIADLKQGLDLVKLQPRQSSVNNILAFSKQYSVNKQSSLFSY